MKPMMPMKPMEPLDFGPAWWPKELGEPNITGGQNDVLYAFFKDRHRLAIQEGGIISLYDSDDHDISGVSQQQGTSSSLFFTSQHGVIDVAALKKAS